MEPTKVANQKAGICTNSDTRAANNGLCGIRVIAADGSYPTLGQSFGRVLSKLLSLVTIFIGYAILIFDIRKRTLHDRLAGTLVVHAIA